MAALAACRGEPAPDIFSSPPKEGTDVGSIASPLLAGRTVEIEQWKIDASLNGTPATVRTGFPDTSAEQTTSVFFRKLMSACAYEELTANGDIVSQVSASDQDVFEGCSSAIPGTAIGVPTLPLLDGSIDPAPILGPFVPLVFNCMAHYMLHVAEETEPLQISHAFQPFGTGAPISGTSVILTHGTELPATFASLADSGGSNTLASFFQKWDPAKVVVEYRVKPPKSSDRATWALLSAELFRASLISSELMLRREECLEGMEVSFTPLTGERTTVRDIMVSNLIDATHTMLEAAEKAQKYIAAAATEKRAGAADPIAALVDGWRGRHDSRLEGVSSFVAVPERLYDKVQPKPYFIMQGYGHSGRTDFLFATTQAASVAKQRFNYGYWMLPPDTWRDAASAPPGYIEVLTYQANGALFTTTSQDVTGALRFRREGWALEATDPTAPVPPGMAILYSQTPWPEYGNGVTVVETGKPYYVFLGRDAPQAVDGNGDKLAVVTALANSNGDIQAEKLLRGYGVNPCINQPVAAPKWCDEALKGQTRSVTNVADDLLALLKAANPAAFGEFTSSDKLLLSEHITKEDLLRASTRIVQSSQALGRPILPLALQAGLPTKVTGTEKDLTPLHPAYLYAITAGDPDKSQERFLNNEVIYGRESVMSLLMYLDSHLPEFLEDADEGSAPWVEQIKQLRGFILSHTELATIVTTSMPSTGDGVSYQNIRRDGLKFPSSAALEAQCGAWLGEVGLACSLGRGATVDCSKYEFAAPANTAEGYWIVQPSSEEGYVFADILLTESLAPPRTIGGTVNVRRILDGDRIYITCDDPADDDGPEVLAAITARKGAQQGAGVVYQRFHAPFSKYLLDILAKGLSPDPDHPEETQLSCAGVPFDVKIPLENELTQASEGQDEIESSFAHYLRLAREAADRADELGSQLVQQGLEMDLRAEDAREALEDLCGGVVNVPSFARAACSGSDTCDIETALTSSISTGDATADSELSGAANCLGFATNSKPDWAAVGDQDLCVWVYYPSGGGKPLLPMVCPDEIGYACSGLSREVKVAGKGSCGAMYNIADLGDSPQAGQVYAKRITRHLNMFVTENETTSMPEGKQTFACQPVLDLEKRWIKEYAYDAPPGYKKQDWMEEAKLYDIAANIGIEEDIFGMFKVTKSGRTWMQFGDESGPYDSSSVQFTWPYKRHWMADPANPDADPKAVAVCDAFGSDWNRPLFCGGWTEDDLRYTIKPRMFDAVLATKIVTGSSFDNVIIRYEQEQDGTFRELLRGGTLPSWYWYDPGSTYWITPAHDKLYATGISKLYTRGAFHVEYFEDPKRTSDMPTWVLGHGGILKYPNNMWKDKPRPAVNAYPPDGHGSLYMGDGDMYRFIRGRRSSSVLAKGKKCWWVGVVGVECDEIGTEIPLRAMLDGMSLACAAQESGALSCDTLLRSPPNLNGVDDFPTIIQRMNCSARAVQDSLDRMYVAGMPGDVITALGGAGPVQTFPEHRGAYGETVANLAGLLITLRSQGDMAVQAMRDVSTILAKASASAEALELNIKIADVQAYINSRNLAKEENELLIQNLNTRQAISSAATACAGAMAEAAGAGLLDTFSGAIAGKIGSAAATCANTAVQVATETQIKKINEANFQLDKDISKALDEQVQLGQQATQAELNAMMAQTTLEISSQFDKVHEALTGMLRTQTDVMAALARLETQRNQARRSAAKVLMLGSDDLGRQYAVNSAMRSRMNTLRVRYEKARDNALRMAYLARRSVEQKLGVSLSFMTDDMTLVEAPAKWADKLCALSGIDYEKIRTGDKVESERNSKSPDDYDYADGYIGDWVTQLSNFVESYSVDKPFQAGEDVAVVSLRDEIMNVREPMPPRKGWNLLYHTDGKTFSSVDPVDNATSRGWTFGCNDGIQTVNVPEEGTWSPFTCEDNQVGCRPLGMAVSFNLAGESVTSCDPGAPPTGPVFDDTLVPPTNNLEYWFRGDACTEVVGSPGWVSTCDNLGTNVAGQNRTLRPNGTSVNMRLLANGIGGQPTLDFPAGAPLAGTQAHPEVLPALTIAVVVRPTSAGQAVLLNTNHSVASGDVTGGALSLQVGSGNTILGWRSTTPYYQAQLSGAVTLGPASPDTRGEIIVATGDSSGTKLWVNGVLTAWSDLPMTPQRIGGWLVQLTGAGAIQLAEHMQYSRALSATEVDTLQAYLSGRYQIPLRGPVRWIEGDDMMAAQTNGGQSPASGYPIGEATVWDRGNGARYVTTGGPTLGTFAGSHFGLEFTGTQAFLTSAAGSKCERLPTDTACVASSVPHDETVMTMVARVNEGSGVNGLLMIGLNSPGLAADLRADAATGKLSMWYGLAAGGGNMYTTPNPVFTAGQPFIVSLHSSSAANRTALYVNGALALEVEDLVISPRGDNRPGTGTSGVVLRGALAEWMWHQNQRSEAEVLELHAQLATKYGLAGEGGGGSGGNTIAGAARMRQVITAERGRYWLSWYQSDERSTGLPVVIDYPDGTSETRVLQKSDPTSTMMPVVIGVDRAEGTIFDPVMEEGWVRYFTEINVPSRGSLGVGFVPSPNGSEALAAIQLERIASDQSTMPSPYFPTSNVLTAIIGHGEDTDGSTFRSRWHRGCEYYCPPGGDRDCAANGDTTKLPKRCFYEADFGISLEEIEKGTLIPQAGFARGNFNYRFGNIAVNLVGTGVKDCSLSNLPSACYGGSFLQYSLQQAGPYRIRDYEGNAVRASLYTGQIQQAKGLLAERYLSNPISGADRNLISDYWRSEFRGRPIDGAFKIRIYDADGLDWNNLEDVQLVMQYRYWTRLQ